MAATDNDRGRAGAARSHQWCESLRPGRASAIAHHGEILQGAFEDEDGRLHRGLITLPFGDRFSSATFRPRRRPGIDVRPAARTKACRAARLTLDFLGHEECGGDLTIESSIAIGLGLGSSTADVIATIGAAAGAVGHRLSRSDISRLAVIAEDASDATAYDLRPVLFAHREGRVIEFFDGEFPPLLIVGVQLGGQPVDTLRLERARYSGEEVQLFRVLRGLAARAFHTQDPRLLGRVAMTSAIISQRHFPKPAFDRLFALCDRFGGCGIQVAHSGTVAGILVDASASNAADIARQLSHAVQHAGIELTSVFTVNGPGAADDER